MSSPRTLAVCLAALCAMSLPAAAAAQQNAGLPENAGLSVEGSVGLRYGHDGSYVDRGGAAVDVLATLPLAEIEGATLIAGLSGGVSGALASISGCVMGPFEECTPRFPDFLSVAALAGMEQPLGSGSLRLLLGPGYYQAFDGPGVLGLQGRADVSTPRIWHVSLVGSVRGNLLPSYEGEMLRLTTYGVGLRIH